MAPEVVLMRAGAQEPAAIGEWGRVREVAGRLMEETEHYPPRYRVRGFPDAATLETIGKGEM